MSAGVVVSRGTPTILSSVLPLHSFLFSRALRLIRYFSTSPVTSLNSTLKMDASQPPGKVLTVDNINPNVRTMEYAVRGPIVIRAVEIEKELSQVYFTELQFCPTITI